MTTALVVSVLCVASAAGWGLHLFAGRSNPGGSSPAAAGGNELSTWVLTRSALNDVGADAAARRAISGRTVYVLGGGQNESTTANPVLTRTFTSWQRLQRALRQHDLPKSTQAVLLDLEAWPATPRSEQRDAARVYGQAASAVHDDGLKFVAAPGMDLARVLDPGTRGPFASRFLATGLLRSVARTADVIVIQSQSLQREPSAYKSFVGSARDQIRSSSSDVTILAGISTGATHGPVGVAQLVSAVRSVRGLVTGFWVNIPRQGRLCPRCGRRSPGIALKALAELT